MSDSSMDKNRIPTGVPKACAPSSVQNRCSGRRRTVGSVLVIVSCALTSVITIGSAFSTTSIYLDIMDSFHTTRPLAALVGSLCVGFGFGSGILTGPILGQVGGAVTMAFGGVLCCAGCVGSSLAPNIYVLIFCFGVLTGAGISCCFLSAQICLGLTFPSQRRLAVTLTTLCAGVGMTTFPAFIRPLVEIYTLRGAFLILAGIFSNCFLFALVLANYGVTKALYVREKEVAPENAVTVSAKETEVVTNAAGAGCEVTDSGTSENGQVPDLNLPASSLEACSRESRDSLDSGVFLDGADGGPRRDEAGSLRIRGRLNEGFLDRDDDDDDDDDVTRGPMWERLVLGERLCPVGADSSSAHPGINLPTAVSQGPLARSGASLPAIPGDALAARPSLGFSAVHLSERSKSFRMTVTDLRENDLKGQHTLVEDKGAYMAVHDSPVAHLLIGRPGSEGECGTPGLTKTSTVVTISQDVQIYGQEMAAQLKTSEAGTSVAAARGRLEMRRRSSLSETFQPSLLRNTPLVLVTLGCITAFFTVHSPGYFLMDIAQGRGLSVAQGTELISLLYGCNVAGRGLIGLLQLKCQVPVVLMLGATTLGCGLLSLGFCFLNYVTDHVFEAYAGLCGVYGLCLGMMVTLTPLSCLELVPLRQTAPAMGYQFFIGGLVSALGGPYGGWLKEVTGNYNAVFYTILAQGVLALSTVLFVVCRGKQSLPQKQSPEARNMEENCKISQRQSPKTDELEENCKFSQEDGDESHQTKESPSTKYIVKYQESNGSDVTGLNSLKKARDQINNYTDGSHQGIFTVLKFNSESVVTRL